LTKIYRLSCGWKMLCPKSSRYGRIADHN
jgi:hypothetical protein